MKCIVRTCPNREGEGKMEGPICSPCAEALRGDASASQPASRRILASVLHILPTDTGDPDWERRRNEESVAAGYAAGDFAETSHIRLAREQREGKHEMGH